MHGGHETETRGNASEIVNSIKEDEEGEPQESREGIVLQS